MLASNKVRQDAKTGARLTLTNFHATVLFQVGPRRVDDGDIVLLVASGGSDITQVDMLMNSPSMELALVSCAQSWTRSKGISSQVWSC